MKNNGWVKLHRKEIESYKTLTDAEFRYYLMSRMVAVWDFKKELFGTFDDRTRIVKEEMLPTWADGKINTIKNSLIKKGWYKKQKDYRLEIKNAKLLFGKGKRVEYLIQESENTIHNVEINIQENEKQNNDLLKDIKKLASNMVVKYDSFD